MPKSTLDWLAIVSLWIGALIEAIKAGGLPLMAGAPSWLASHVWGYVPFILVTFYLVVAFFRLVKPTEAGAAIPAQTEKPNRAANPALVAVREDRRIMSALQDAMNGAAGAIGIGTPRAAEQELPIMKAALLSAHKHFQIPLPDEKPDARTNLELGRRLIEKVLPFLEAGHTSEARAEADKYLKRFKPQD